MPESPRASQAPEPVPAALLGARGVFVWQKALHVAGTALPEKVRYTLCVLALYMNPNGTQGRPGYQRFVLARGGTERTLRRHLDQAIDAGWLLCVQRGGRAGDGSTRASVYMATFPAEVFARLGEVLTPAWGDCEIPQPEPDVPLAEPAQPDTHERPVEIEPHPDTQGCPDEDSQPDNPQVSTGQSSASTGHAACPPTDHSHRPDTPISQSTRARERQATRWLHNRYGLTDEEAATVIEAVRARAAEPVGSLIAYMESMTVTPDGAPSTDLLDIVEAVQIRSAPAPLEPGQPDDDRHLTSLPTAYSQTAAEAIAAANPDQPTPRPAEIDEHGLPAIKARAALKTYLDEVAERSRARRIAKQAPA